jgi:hypothetical protein
VGGFGCREELADSQCRFVVDGMFRVVTCSVARNRDRTLRVCCVDVLH